MKRTHESRRGTRDGRQIVFSAVEALEGRLLLSGASGNGALPAAHTGNNMGLPSTSVAITRAAGTAAPVATATSIGSESEFLSPGQYLSELGHAVFFYAAVDATTPGAPAPTGTVTLTIDGVAMAPVAVFADLEIPGVSETFISTSALGLGRHTVVATYNGDATDAPSVSAAIVQLVQPAGQNPTTTTLAASPNPSAVGQSVTLTATVAMAPDAFHLPVGAVEFFEGQDLLGIGQLNNGRATFVTTSLAAGPHALRAVYSADGESASSTGATTVVVLGPGSPAEVAATVSLASSPVATLVGQAATFTATVTPASGPAGTPTGPVYFFEGTTVLGLSPLDASGHATFVTTSLVAGPHAITAVYGGDANFTAATASTAQFVAVPDGTAPSVARLRRFGVGSRPSTLVLTFDGPLDPASAQSSLNYRLVDSRGRPVRIAKIAYDPATLSTTLTTRQRLALDGVYHLRVIGSGPAGVKGADGQPLAGFYPGRPGTDYKAVVDRSTLVLTQTTKTAKVTKITRLHPKATVAATLHAASGHPARSTHRG